jgi:hypothetical protein
MEANHILKFKKIDKRLIDSLVHSQLYFPRPEDLNDPFDCQVDIEKSLRKAISQSSGFERETLESFLNNDELRKEFKKAQQDIKNYGVFSGSHSPALSSSLMWSHYADSHRGLCLIYAIPIEPRIFYELNQIFGIQNVIYGSNQLTDWFKELPANENIHDEVFTKMIQKILTIKDNCWKYGDEVRMIRRNSGIVSIDKSYLQHVCFGLDTSKDEMKLIREILAKFNYDIGYSRMQRTENDFGIQAVDID